MAPIFLSDKQYGYLATRDYYNDFDLNLEFKQLANGNSGVFFRSFIEPPVKIHGWQCEVAPMGNDTGGQFPYFVYKLLLYIFEYSLIVLSNGYYAIAP